MTWYEYEVGRVPQSYPNTLLTTSDKLATGRGESPTFTLNVTKKPSIYQVEVTSLWPETAVAESETHNIYVWWWTDMSMKWVGCPNHILTHTASDKWQTKTKDSPTANCHIHIDCETQRISGLDCKHMTTGYNRRWWNTLYIFIK
jgi:hypothetical protein